MRWRIGHRAAQTAEAQPPILPGEVRYALQNKKKELNGEDVTALFRNGFNSLGLYMVMKASKDDDSVQETLLRRVARRDFDPTRFTAADASSGIDLLRSQNPSSVEGGKLHLVASLYGVQHWSSRVTEVLAPVLAQKPESELFMVANAPYIAIDKLAALSIHKGKSLGILKPSRFQQGEGRSVGFMLEPTADGTDITPLAYDFERPEEAIIFDDQLHTGTVRNQVMEFWGDESRAEFITAIAFSSTVEARPPVAVAA